MNSRRIETTRAITRRWCSRAMFAANVLLFGVIIVFFSYHRASFDGDWNGPTVATMALTAATIVMAAVTLMVGIIAIWGYATLREQAENIARETAQDAVDEMRRQIALLSIGTAPNDDDGETETLGYGEDS